VSLRQILRLSWNSSAERSVPLSEFGMTISHAPVSLACAIRQASVGLVEALIRFSRSVAAVSLHFCCIFCVVEHAMSCKKGGLIVQCHNDLKAEWHHLCVQALTATAITDEPLIHMSQDVRQAGAAATEPQPELRGDVSAHGFWKRGTTTIFDIQVTDMDAASYRMTEPKTILQCHE